MATILVPAGQINLKGPQSPTGVDRWISGQSVLGWTGLAAACLISVAMPAGAVAFTGQTPNLQSTFLFEPATAPLTFTGLAPTVQTQAAVVATPSAGAIVFQGLTPSLRIAIDLVFQPAAGQIVFKGPASPGSQIPNPDVGREVFTGQVPQLLISTPGSLISMPAGSLVFTGQVPDRISNLGVNPGCGSLAFVGYYVVVAFKTPDAGALVWQGLIPTVVVNSQGSIAMPVGALRFTSDAPVSHLDRGPAMPAGSLVFAGQAPQSGQTSTIAVPAGSLVFTGQTPSSQRVIFVTPGLGQLLYSSDLAPVVHLDTFVNPTAGALAFTGLTPVVAISVTDTTIAVGAGSELFSSQAPVVVLSAEILPDAGSLVFSGGVPSANVGNAPAIPAGALVFTGLVPIAQNLGPFVPPAGRLVFTGIKPRVLNSGVNPDTGLFEYYSLYLY